MKKILTVLLVMLFVFGSLPIVFADDVQETINRPRLVKAQMLKERIQEKRQLTQQEITEARSNFQEAKENYLDHKEQFQVKKQLILGMKSRWEQCKDSDTEDCMQVREQFVGYGKDYVEKAAEALLKYLDQVYNKIKLNEDIEEEEKEQKLDEISGYMDQVSSIIDRIDSAETKEELRNILDELKDLINEIKPRIKHNVTNLYRHKIGEIIVRAEQLEIKLQKLLDRAEEAGYDVTDLENMIDDFEGLIKSARDNYYKAKEILDQFSDEETTDSNKVQEAHDLLRQAHNDLNSAQKVLRDILHKIKGMYDEFVEQTEECWADRPDYRPGYDLGYFIWQGSCRNTWYLDWSGDMKQPTTTNERPRGYIMRGTITAVDGEFVNVGVKAFDRFDKFEWSGDTITFKAWVGPHFDGIHFKSTGTQIEFDIYVDGEHNTELVYIGKDWENPTEIPFVLEGEAVVIDDLEIVCEDGQLLVKNECVDEIEEMEIEEITGNGKKYEVAVPMDTI